MSVIALHLKLILIMFGVLARPQLSEATATERTVSGDIMDNKLDNLHPRWIYLMGGDDKAWLSSQQPGPRSRVASWADSQGNLWSFSGIGIDSEAPTAAHLTNDLWFLDVSAMNWTEVVKPSLNSSSEKIPAIRRGAVACGVDNLVLVVFGGQTVQEAVLEDTWVYEIKKKAWIPLHDMPRQSKQPTNPPPRVSPVCWCLKDRMIMFGGLSENGIILQDMWQFSMRNLSWSPLKLDAKVTTMPSGRTGATSWVTDKKLYMYGGATQSNNPDNILQSDLWEFNLQLRTWTNLHRGLVEDGGSYLNNGPAPQPRKYAQGWFEPLSESLYLFGGEGHPDSHVLNKRPTLSEDLWGYSLESETWHQISYFAAAEKVENSKLSVSTVRTRGAMWKGPGDTFYTFGGVAYDADNQLSLLNDVWVLVPPNVPLPKQVQETSLEILRFPEVAASHTDPGFIFLVCLLTVGGVVLVVGAFFFLRKMSDYPKHRSGKEYKAKYSKLARSEDSEDASDFLRRSDTAYERKASALRVDS